MHAGDKAFDALDQSNPALAAAIARVAVDRNPLSVDPLFELSAMEQARGDTAEAERVLERAVRLQPANAEAWRRLGRFRLDVLNDAPGALTAFRAAYSLDPASPTSVSDVLEATRATQAPYGRRADALSPVRSSGGPPHGRTSTASNPAWSSVAASECACRSAGAGRAGRSARRSAPARPARPSRGRGTGR